MKIIIILFTLNLAFATTSFSQNSFLYPDERTIDGMLKTGLNISEFEKKKSIIIWHHLYDVNYWPDFNKDFYIYPDNNLYIYFKYSSGEEDRIKFNFVNKKSNTPFVRSNSIGWKGKTGIPFTFHPLQINRSYYSPLPPIYFSINPAIYFLTSYIEGYTKQIGTANVEVPSGMYYQIIYMQSFEDLINILDITFKDKLITYIFDNKDKLDFEYCLKSPTIKATADAKIFNELKSLAIVFCAKDIADELKKSQLFAPKDEFENKEDYIQRQKKADAFRDEINNKYTLIYKDYVECKETERIEKIKKSYAPINLKITQLGSYNAEKEVFPIIIEGLKPLEFKIPKLDAKSFKENLQNVKVSAEKQLMEDATTYQYFNIEIIHPITGSKYLLHSGKPLYLDYFSKDLDETGIPILKPSVKFIEPSGNDLLDGNEAAKFEVRIENSGDGTAQNVNINLSAIAPDGITFEKTKSFTGIAPSQSQTATFEVKADRTISNNEIPFKFDFTEARGFKPGIINYTINTQAFKAPHLVLKDVGIKEISGNGNNIIENGENIEVSVLIQNSGQGLAQDALTIVSISDPNIIALTPTKMRQSINDLQPGDSRIITFNFSVNYDYKGAVLLPITLVLSEKYKEYGGNFPLNLDMKKVSLATANIKVEGQYAKDLTIKDVSFTSDVDKNIPINPTKNPDRYALIIGNEDYSSRQSGLNPEVNVAFAINDAKTFKEYCINTLGIEEKNVLFLTNATTGEMQQKIELVTQILKRVGSNSELVFYYAGHGFPDENSKEPYLIPVDITATSLISAIKLYDVYKKFSQTGASRITVFLDACFTGGGRESGLLAARGVKVKPKEENVSGNMVIFAATSEDQSALPYKEKQHGMFTYFLLKKIQETKGDINYGELEKYLSKNVSVESLRVNSKTQDPKVNVSSQASSIWETWKLK